eukprot:GFUD01110472.1.p1 GENE.GFUD01110472.1~~GFUD01110472.1.p1  ORF type:complete len:182 (+),score=36.90 GFUD01110472.1:340-885(+)
MKLTQKIRNVIKRTLSKKDKKSKYAVISCPADDSSDYVSGDDLDKLSGDSISLYQCEMPAEKLARIKALSFSKLRELPVGLRNQSARRISASSDEIEMGSYHYHGRHCSLTLARNTQEDLMPPLNLVGAKTHARGMPISPDHGDYMNMEEPNYDDYMYFSEAVEPPPPYSEKDPIGEPNYG